MTDYPRLTYIDVVALAAAAGGSPWQVDESLQCGDPGAVSDLSRAFISAGACTAETYSEFEKAQVRFRASWVHRGSEHPISDSVEVQRATSNLMVQREHLPAIGATLAGIGADLAEAQRFSNSSIGTLNAQLEYVDSLVGGKSPGVVEFRARDDGAGCVVAGIGVGHRVVVSELPTK